MTTRAFAVAFCACTLALAVTAVGQTGYGGQRYYYTPATTAAAAATRPASPALKPEELEQVVAPVALYPDSLLAQVLMASTYPLELVQAERWVKQNPSLKASADALNKLTWDPSVKSLIDFPQVLTMMSEKLDWTVKLGDAFIADQKAVMDAVQRLRNKAYAQGNLKTTREQNVKVEAPPATAPASVAGGGASSSQVIVIESSNPSVVYVPTYNPTVVYGGWPYPSYPPYYYYPPGYVAGTAALSFGLGVACGAAWGHAWGDCDWHGGDVEVDIDKNVNFNGNIDREKYKAERDARQGNRDTRQTDRQGNRDTRQTNRQGGGARSFQHDPSHRQGVAYRDAATSERFRGGNTSQTAAQARESYRGRAEAGRQDIARGGADAYRGSGSAGARTMDTRGGGSAGARTMDARGGGFSSGSAGARDLSGTRSSGFSGSSASGTSARAASSRGQASRSASSYSTAAAAPTPEPAAAAGTRVVEDPAGEQCAAGAGGVAGVGEARRSISMRGLSSWVYVVMCCSGGLVLAASTGCASFSSSAPPADQLTFASPDVAVTTLVDALRHEDEARLRQILGPAGEDILSSGDPVADRADAARFLALYDQKHSFQSDGDGVETLIVGNDAWPFPVQIVKSGRKYLFDTASGREEILNRRVGRNELSAQQVCLAIIDAQQDYVAMRPMGGDLPEYAQKVVSDPGTKNGLFWPTAANEPPSPIGPLIASAAQEGYGSARASSATTRPARPAYHGYRYRLLTAQGPSAKGGPLQYLVNGRLIGGFGVVAYPAEYGNSGIMTFITNHDGVIYQRDLGVQTERLAEHMSTFDPGRGWTTVADSSQLVQRD